MGATTTLRVRCLRSGATEVAEDRRPPSPLPLLVGLAPNMPLDLGLALPLREVPHARPTFITSTRAPTAASTAQMPRAMVSGGSLEDATGHASQLGPPQSAPTSLPLRTPSVQDTRAPGMRTHALPTAT